MKKVILFKYSVLKQDKYGKRNAEITPNIKKIKKEEI